MSKIKEIFAGLKSFLVPIGYVVFVILVVYLIGQYTTWEHLREGWTEPTMLAGLWAECPSDHPIKANANSMIFHFPGDPYYARTNANVKCFDSAEHAVQQGFRQSLR